MRTKALAEQVMEDIRREKCKRHSPAEKIRIALLGLRAEVLELKEVAADFGLENCCPLE